MRIILIGHRGAGKTTAGCIVAARLDVPFIDTDAEVARAAGMTIREIFAVEGESGFRTRERAAVQAALESKSAVIALGGGAVCNGDVAGRIRSAGRVIWLRATAAALDARTKADDRSADSRPELADARGPLSTTQLLEQRGPIYAGLADVVIDTESRGPDDVAADILRCVRVV